MLRHILVRGSVAAGIAAEGVAKRIDGKVADLLSDAADRPVCGTDEALRRLNAQVLQLLGQVFARLLLEHRG